MFTYTGSIAHSREQQRRSAFTIEPPNSPGQRARHLFLAARVRTLATAGLSEEIEPGRWQIDPAFLAKLKAMQIGRDRQKLMALQHGGDLCKSNSPVTQRTHVRTARDPAKTIVR